MNNPWMKFYPSDWRSDPMLRMCSLEARGLWVEIIALMHESEPYGHLLVGGKSPSPSQLATLVGSDIRTVNRCLSELREASVYSVDNNEIIYSRRMVRDNEKAIRDKNNGKGGGNPILKEVNGGVNPPVKGKLKAQKPDAIFHNLDKKIDASASGFDPKEALAALGVPSNLIADFLKVRSGHKAPFTETALKGIQREANKANWSMPDAIKKCVEKGWRSFEASWVNKNEPVIQIEQLGFLSGDGAFPDD